MLMSEVRREFIGDQAAGLRRVTNVRPVRVIAVTSGKGGVGKTNVSVNLGAALANEGKSVLIMDADMGLANVDVLLGLRPSYNLSHVINGERTLEEIILTAAHKLSVIPASSGLKSMVVLSSAQHAGIIRAFSELSQNMDVLIIDTAAGISESVISFSRAAQEVIVVLCDEPASITDAYALIKLLNRDYGMHRFRILANMVQGVQEGRDLYNKIVKVVDRYLDATLDFMGTIPYDEYLKKAVQKQRSVVDAYPRSKSAMSFKKLAHKTDSWPVTMTAGGHLEFFVERLIQSNQFSGAVQP